MSVGEERLSENETNRIGVSFLFQNDFKRIIEERSSVAISNRSRSERTSGILRLCERTDEFCADEEKTAQSSIQKT